MIDGIKVGGRTHIDTKGTQIKAFMPSDQTIPNAHEYLGVLRAANTKQADGNFSIDSPYRYEQGMTPEDQIMYALTHLEETNQIIDDYQGRGSVSWQIGAYFPASGYVPIAYWDPRRSAGGLG